MIRKLFLILASILVIPDIYIYKMFVSRNTDCPVWKLLYFLPSLLLLAGLVYIVFFANQRALGEKNQIGWFVIAFLSIALPKLIFFLCSLLDLPLRYLLKWNAMPFSWLGVILGIVCAGCILYGAFKGKTRFDVKEVTFLSSAIPEAFEGYKLVQLSDIHIGSWMHNEKALQRAVKLINEQQPDVILFTGDLVNHRATELNGFQHILAGMKAKDGVYSVLGNHDYGPYYPWKSAKDQADNLKELQQREADMGWILLNNCHTRLHRGNDSITLIGVENWGLPPFNGRGDLKKAMQGAGKGFKILMSHNPTHWKAEVVPETDIDLTLAGHTHAMQLAVGQHSPSSWIYKEWKGMYKEGRQHLYVNVGLGFIGIPFRFGAWPEITVITLKRGSEEKIARGNNGIMK